MDAGELWNVSNASCRTIAKKPNFQVWNGSVYTRGSIKTSISEKMANTSESAEDTKNNYDGKKATVFGSWVDYAIVTNANDGGVAGISSGAVLGYNNDRYDLAGGGISSTKADNYRNLSPMTINNSGSKLGVGLVDASDSVSTNLKRLNSRYRGKTKTYTKEDGYDTTGAKKIYTHSTGMQYVYYDHDGDDVSISELTIDKTTSNPNQTTSWIGNKSNVGSSLVKTLGEDNQNDNTLVIYVTGNLTIDRNICLDDGTGCSGDPTKLRTYETISTKSSAKLPQVLIFAKNIYITQDVNRVDAWLIAQNGTIDTCKGFKIGVSNKNYQMVAARDAEQRYTTYGNCYKTLVVNGPVFAKSIALKRTAGNTHGFLSTEEVNVLDRSIGSIGTADDANKGSASPAEIFNLRADVYIWAYTQAERYSEAVVTYTRELAPRY